MTDPFIGEIKMFSGTFAPSGWQFCDGRLITIADHEALYTLLDTTYGGDGVTTFGLPDLRARIPISQSPNQPMGNAGGSESVLLQRENVPPHAHTLQATTGAADRNTPATNAMLSATGTNIVWTKAATAPNAMMSGNSVSHSQTGGATVSTISPFLVINYIIALNGIFPSRP